jgi:hypothetical protein
VPLANDLLERARLLATVDVTRPKQASLRRAVSSAYYAVFHLLLAACMRRIAPSTPAGLAERIVRSLAHSEMKEVCVPISRGSRVPAFDSLVPAGFSPEIRRVAQAFVNLQVARHRADYDLLASFSRTDTLDLLSEARRAFEDWYRVQDTDEANVFLSALLFAKRWSK